MDSELDSDAVFKQRFLTEVDLLHDQLKKGRYHSLSGDVSSQHTESAKHEQTEEDNATREMAEG
jgi:hypothetical protein